MLSSQPFLIQLISNLVCMLSKTSLTNKNIKNSTIHNQTKPNHTKPVFLYRFSSYPFLIRLRSNLVCMLSKTSSTDCNIKIQTKPNQTNPIQPKPNQPKPVNLLILRSQPLFITYSWNFVFMQSNISQTDCNIKIQTKPGLNMQSFGHKIFISSQL